MAAPPRILEKLVEILIPPVPRQQVMGDLHERYSGPWAYLADALATAPWVILSRIRRTSEPGMRLLEALALYLSFVGVVWLLGPREFLYGRMAFLRLGIPAAAALAGLVLVDAYTNPAKRRPIRPLIETALGVAFAGIAQAVLAATEANLALPPRILLLGCLTSVSLVALLRAFFAAGNHRPTGTR